MVNSARIRQGLFAVALVFYFSSARADAQTTAFTYQGKLSNNGSPASGDYDFEFRLFDAVTVGAQQGTTQTLTNVGVSNGIFSVQLDYGPCATCFTGARRFLDITVRVAGGGAFTPLTPRQEVTSNPYALKSLNAATADGLSAACTNCVMSGQIQSVSGNAVTGTIPIASVPSGSDNYIQNRTSMQAGSNFNISGNGIVGGNLGVGTNSPSSKFEVIDASNTGLRVQTNTTGGTVASFGGNGAFNVDASGVAGGRFTVLENGSTGIGTNDPLARLDIRAGANNDGSTDKPPALSFQYLSGGFRHWIRTRHNSFVGSGNAFDFFVNNSAAANGSTGPGAGSLHVLSLDSGKVGIGTMVPASKLHVSVGASSTPISAAAIDVQSFTNAGNAVASHYFRVRDVGSGSPSAFFIRGDGNIGVGTETPNAKLHVTGTGVIRALVDSDSNAGFGLRLGNQPKWSVATVTGGHFQIFNDALGQNAVFIDAATNSVDFTNNSVGIGTGTPHDKLEVVGDIRVWGCVKDALTLLPIAGISCLSDERVKRNIEPFEPALEKLARIQPVRFDWRADEYPELNLASKRSYGLLAQEVEKAIPEMVGEGPHGFKTVNYSVLPLFLLQAIRELKMQNDALREELRIQNQQLQNIQQLQTELQEIRGRLRNIPQ